MAHSTSIIALEELDLFAIPPVQKSIERDYVTMHGPLTTISGHAPLQFEIKSNEEEYIKLSETELYLKIRLTLSKPPSTGGVPSPVVDGDWATVSTANNILHSIFKHVKLFIGDNETTLNPQNYSYKAYFETLLGFHESAKKTHLSSVGWTNDSSVTDTLNAARTTMITPAAGKTFKELELMGKIFIDLSFQPRALLGGTTVKLEFLPNSPSFYIQKSNASLNVDVEFTDAKIFCHRSKVTSMIVDAHRKALSSSPACYPLTRTEVKAYTIPSTLMATTIDNVIHGHLPRRIILALVDNASYLGSYTSNPYNFQTFKLNQLAVYLDGLQFPSVAYTPNFTEGHYLREYLGLFEALNQDTTDSVIPFDRTGYKNGYTMYGFNFSPDLSSGAGGVGHVSENRYGSMRISVGFEEALRKAVTVLVYCEYDNLLCIDQNRQAATDYSRWTLPK